MHAFTPISIFDFQTPDLFAFGKWIWDGTFVGMIQQLEDDAGAVLFWGVQTKKQGEIFASELDDATERCIENSEENIFT